MTSADAAAEARRTTPPPTESPTETAADAASESVSEAAAQAAVGRYLEFWNAEPDEQRRRAAATFTDDVEYRSLVGVMRGAEPLVEFRTGFIEHVGAASFVARAQPQAQHGRVRLAWEIRLAAGDSFAEGTDFLVLAADGRIASVAAFLDRAPEGFDQHEHAGA